MQTQTITVRLDKISTNLLKTATQNKKQTSSDIVRKALKAYLQKPSTSQNGAEFLTAMAKDAQDAKQSAPMDTIKNMDDYLYQKTT
ncbi:hypothetical protein CO180_04370 [candidate division WWE3 bacterium CG_4_9_14_3_um_filter_41_6]|uniref:Uncharacterized protein n=1 Tax=candidate division WWE3 bacterium CG_4_10_14_0_2_um_filter_41_14 TaxID=1975072 RepID=A0A2M7TLY8_UNCKA|nr:MAG: hypothetical protein COY32_00415 [candidate division WWE3 bacterium CG_4_10_14_0_2_um_filter_41_14]PJA38094.1 MAG: hypothetical protein CO180_04370 [candidate division WWE3 bacterium CG_4_9_14_3_um_filter_41_6]